MWRKSYYQYVEKDTNQVSLAWKVLHASIFLATFVCSLISAYAFDQIFKNFDHRCILHASPNLILEEIVFKPNSTRNPSITHTGETVTSSEIAQTMGETQLTNSSNVKLNEPEWWKTGKLRGFKDGRIWFRNETLYGKIDMKRLGTTFGGSLRCSTVIFVPLMSLLVSAVLGVIMVICGRGGRGFKTDIMSGSWSFVYPLIFVSAVMTIQSIIAAILVNDGLQSFCSHFENFTGQSRCNRLMNYFTLDGDRVFDEFWERCSTCYYSFSFGVLLWTSQMSLTVLRLLRVVDFQFTSMSVESKMSEINIHKIHEAVLLASPGAKTFTEIVNDDIDDRSEDIANHYNNDQDKVTEV